MKQPYDLAIIGAGSGGLTAAAFAARLGARVALIEKNRIGGDCTWTGCIPSKALIHAAKVAQEARTAARFGIVTAPVSVDMAKVREHIRSAVEKVYRAEDPETLAKRGIDVIFGGARFVDAHTIAVGDRLIRAARFLITTGARPTAPNIEGLSQVPWLSYQTIFDNGHLPAHLMVVGGGPIGAEIAQAYRRLGSAVTVIAPTLLPKEEPEARSLIGDVFAEEGIQWIRGRARSARMHEAEIVVQTDDTNLPGSEVRGNLLLVASGRRPDVAGLCLDQAGVRWSPDGIPVDDQLRTSVRHIYAAGDVTGGPQFTHLAGWQAFQAVRNALLPGSTSGHPKALPRVTFTDPEVAHVGLTEEQARAQYGSGIRAARWDMAHTDRAICEGDERGFVKIVTKANGTVLGATVVSARAGETITEFVYALERGWNVKDLASAIHAYPTWSVPVQQLASEMAVGNLLSGASGSFLLQISKMMR